MKSPRHGFLGLALPLPLLLVMGCEQFGNPPADSTEPGQASAELRIRPRLAVLKNAAGASVGHVVFTALGRTRSLVTATINFPGIRAGFHGFHLHANNNPANGVGCVADPAQPPATHFVSADGHWNPDPAFHGEHAGDMPSPLVLADGTAFLSFKNDIDLSAPDIAGLAVIFHEGPDNFGNIPLTPPGGDPAAFPNAYSPNSPGALTLTQNTGNAGSRIACGIVQ